MRVIGIGKQDFEKVRITNFFYIVYIIWIILYIFYAPLQTCFLYIRKT